MMLPDVMTVYKRGAMMRQGLGMNWYGPTIHKAGFQTDTRAQPLIGLLSRSDDLIG